MNENDYNKFILLPLDIGKILLGIGVAVIASFLFAKNIGDKILVFCGTNFLEIIGYSIFYWIKIRHWKSSKIDFDTYKKFAKVVDFLGTAINKKHHHDVLRKKLTYAYSANDNMVFNPDDNVIESLWTNCDKLLAFTNADVSTWFQSTFNFYLLNNYLRSITGNLQSPTSHTFGMCNHRNEPNFQKFIGSLKTIELNNLANGNFVNLQYFTNRFYFLSRESIKQNSNLVSNMLSSHDLCGCYLHLVKDATEDNGYRFIINRDVNRCLYEFLESVGRLSTEEIDFAISINTQVNPNKLWILYRTSEQLERQELNSCQINFFKSFLNDLCSNRTVNADPFYDINTLLMHGTNPILPQNNNFVHIYKE